MLVGNMASMIENNLTNRLKGLDNFLQSCIINRYYESSETESSETVQKLNLLKKTSIFGGGVTETLDKIFFEGAANTLENFAQWWESKKLENIWIGITGSTKYVNEKVVQDTTDIVRFLTSQRIGIINGAALGVCYIANEIVLKEGNHPDDPNKQLVNIYPNKKEIYRKRIMDAVKEKKIHEAQAEKFIEQSLYIEKNYPEIIFDDFNIDDNLFLTNEGYRDECYHFRDILEAYASDGMIPFWINDSTGVEDTINKAKSMGKPVFESPELRYTINPKSKKVIIDYESLIIPNLRADYPLKDKLSPILSRFN